MPYHYHSSLAHLNFSSSVVYEVSALLSQDLGLPWGGAWLGPHSHTRPPKPWVLRLVWFSALVLASYVDELLCVTESCQPPGSWVPLFGLGGTFLRFSPPPVLRHHLAWPEGM